MKRKVKFFYVDDITSVNSLATLTYEVNSFTSSLKHPESVDLKCYQNTKSSLASITLVKGLPGLPDQSSEIIINKVSSFISLVYSEPD